MEVVVNRSTFMIIKQAKFLWTVLHDFLIDEGGVFPNNSILNLSSYVQEKLPHNSMFVLSGYVEDPSRHLDSSWTTSGLVQLYGLGVEAQCT